MGLKRIKTAVEVANLVHILLLAVLVEIAEVEYAMNTVVVYQHAMTLQLMGMRLTLIVAALAALARTT
jgi:hypothetical protein